MSLAKTWLEAELCSGKTQDQAIQDMGEAVQYRLSYPTVFRWMNGDRNPRPEARRYMMSKAVPYLHRRMADKPIRLSEYVEALL